MMPPGNRWSTAKLVLHISGYFKLGLATSSSYEVFAATEPGVGRLASIFLLKIKRGSPGVVTVPELNNNPLFDAWFDIHTNGTVPAKIPVPPRTCVVWSPNTSQLKPTRGETRTRLDGNL